MSQGLVSTGDQAGYDPSPLRWWALALSAIAIFSSYYESDAIGPIADLLGRQRGLSQLQIGDLTAVISLPNIPLAVINGLLVDRYGPARISLWAALIGICGTRAMVPALRHCAGHGVVPEPCACWVVLARHVTHLGPFAL